MAKSVKVNFPNLAKGELVAVDGVGMVPNGSTQKVEDYQALAWESFYGATWPESGTLLLPAPPGESNVTAAQSEGELQTAIIARQEARSPEEAKAEERAATLENIKGNVQPGPLVDGKLIEGAKVEKNDPIVEVAPKSDTEGK